MIAWGVFCAVLLVLAGNSLYDAFVRKALGNSEISWGFILLCLVAVVVFALMFLDAIVSLVAMC